MTTTPGSTATTPPVTPAQCADAAADLVRTINHTTRPDVIDGAVDGGLGQVGEVYDTVAGLALMTARLPQALAQLRAFLTAQADTGRLVAVDEYGHRSDPAALVAAVTEHLLRAARDAHALAADLDNAQQTLASLGHR